MRQRLGFGWAGRVSAVVKPPPYAENIGRCSLKSCSPPRNGLRRLTISK